MASLSGEWTRAQVSWHSPGPVRRNDAWRTHIVGEVDAGEGELALRALNPARFEEFWSLFQDSLTASADDTAAMLGLSKEQYERLPHEVGELQQVEVGDAVAGFVWLEIRARELHLHALLLVPAFRGRGVGRRVLAALADRYDGEVDVFELGVEPGNLAARRLYEHGGFSYADERDGFLIMRRPSDRGRSGG
jgi:ribosomal protein S18 acetylase RimI-like enzyme